ncbi:hypothetical protein [Paenibacillus sp. SYP-B4298]|uniref:hypothetical protein n=1 Tax=Paenibacillus sp. SYP-B4298 TaxID=2996034 RepID=UPI0022DD40A5|nr:hypothetical protein [Paenibacillus sp. SYP-B4298]
MRALQLIETLIQHEEQQRQEIHLVPSENAATMVSRLPLLMDMYNRYFFNEQQDALAWNFNGARNVADLETKLTIPLLKELSGARYVNVRPVSGLQAMLMVFMAVGGGAGAHILTVSPHDGGHYATKGLAAELGLHAHGIAVSNLDELDMTEIERQLERWPIRLIYLDQSNGLFPFPVAPLAELVRRRDPSIHMHVDTSHWLGLILGGAIPNPLAEGADSFGGSTHKTFPGPQKALICTNESTVALRLKLKQHDLISSHHFGATASLGIALMEFKEHGAAYSRSILRNARRMAACLDHYGYVVIGKELGYTGGHQVWVNPEAQGLGSYEASERLYRVGIHVNVVSPLPTCEGPVIRLGLNEFSRLGAEESHTAALADIMHRAMMQTDSEAALRKEVRSLRQCLPDHYGLELGSDEIRKKYDDLLRLVLTGLQGGRKECD